MASLPVVSFRHISVLVTKPNCILYQIYILPFIFVWRHISYHSLREKYSVSLRIQSKYGKIRTRKKPVFGHFLRIDFLSNWLQSRNFVFWGEIWKEPDISQTERRIQYHGHHNIKHLFRTLKYVYGIIADERSLCGGKI